VGRGKHPGKDNEQLVEQNKVFVRNGERGTEFRGEKLLTFPPPGTVTAKKESHSRRQKRIRGERKGADCAVKKGGALDMGVMPAT